MFKEIIYSEDFKKFRTIFLKICLIFRNIFRKTATGAHGARSSGAGSRPFGLGLFGRADDCSVAETRDDVSPGTARDAGTGATGSSRATGSGSTVGGLASKDSSAASAIDSRRCVVTIHTCIGEVGDGLGHDAK